MIPGTSSGDNESVVRVAATDGERLVTAAREVADAVSVIRTGPTGVDACDPLVAATSGGRTALFPDPDPATVRTVAETLANGSLPETDAAAVVEHDPETVDLPAAEIPGLNVGDRTVLGGCGWRRPTEAADHEAAGGFVDPDPETVSVYGADLRGRGWGDWCHDERVGETWETIRDADGEVTVVVNAHGTPADELLLSSAPFEVLEGVDAVADTVNARRAVVYASEEAAHALETVRTAVENYPDPKVPVDVVSGPDEYRAAEPTMALEAIEGNHRLEARLRPPGPDEVGLHGRPTLVHTPRTFAHLSVALREGALPDTRLLTVTGDVAASATVELPETDPLAAGLDAVEIDGEFKAACVGGRFGGVTADLDVAVDAGSLSSADLGTEGTVQVLADDRCVVEFVGRRARFASEENCGRCVPCREGTTQLANQLRDIYDGDYDPDGIEELVRVMDTSSICAFGVDAGRPTRTALDAFEAEFEAHADGRCPAGRCLETLEAS